MAANRWSAEDYAYQMEAVGALGDAARAYVTEMNKYLSVELTRHGRNYDPNGAIADSVGRFTAATARLQNLHESMKQYEQEYSAMLENAQSTMENVTVENTVYGTFGALVAGGTAMASVYAGSVAWQFWQSGFDFNTHFGDFQTFQDNPNYNFFEGAQALSEMASWESHTVDLLISNLTGGGTDYAEELEMSALMAALESVPGYMPTNTEEMDWGWLGDKLGVPGLGKDIEKIIKWISGLEGSLDYEQMSDELTNIMFNDGAGTSELAAIFQSFMEADKLGAFMGELTKYGFSVGKAAETYFEILYHLTANHISQIEYLDSVDEAMAMAGYSEVGGLRGTLQSIRESFVNSEKYFLDMTAEKVEEILENKLGEAVTQGANTVGQVLLDNLFPGIPGLAGAAADVTPLQYANVVIDGVGLAVDLAGEDQIKAVETLQGLQIYTPTLISSFEKNMALIEAGVADAEDIANADNLFQLIRSAKIKEYEAMLTLQSHGDLAVELGQKLALLERMESLEDFATIPDSHLPSSKK